MVLPSLYKGTTMQHNAGTGVRACHLFDEAWLELNELGSSCWISARVVRSHLELNELGSS